MITYKIIKSKNYAYVEITGRPSLSEFMEASLKFTQEPDYSPDLDRLCDFSQANLEHLTLAHFMEYAEFASMKVRLQRGTRVALVARDNDSTSIYRTFAEQVGTKVFVDPAEAVEWIQSAPEPSPRRIMTP